MGRIKLLVIIEGLMVAGSSNELEVSGVGHIGNVLSVWSCRRC